MLFEVTGDQHFDQRLTRDTQPSGFLVEGANHPDGKVYVDSLLLLTGAPGTRQVQVFRDVLACFELLVERLSLHRYLSLPAGTGERR